jgi:hypothetical protein
MTPKRISPQTVGGTAENWARNKLFEDEPVPPGASWKSCLLKLNLRGGVALLGAREQ